MLLYIKKNICVFLNFQLLAQMFYVLLDVLFVKKFQRTHFMSLWKTISFFQDVAKHFAPKNVSYGLRYPLEL